jgi:hypothetical protein
LEEVLWEEEAVKMEEVALFLPPFTAHYSFHVPSHSNHYSFELTKIEGEEP